MLDLPDRQLIDNGRIVVSNERQGHVNWLCLFSSRLNELCLLNYLKNPNEINELNVLIGELCIEKTEAEQKEITQKVTVTI